MWMWWSLLHLAAANDEKICASCWAGQLETYLTKKALQTGDVPPVAVPKVLPAPGIANYNLDFVSNACDLPERVKNHLSTKNY